MIVGSGSTRPSRPDTEGDAEVEQGVHPLLDEATLRWALRQSYDPATRNGARYAEWYSESAKFELVD